MQALIKQVLAAWREAERVVEQSGLGTREQRAAAVAVERLRTLYMELTSATRPDPAPASGAGLAQAVEKQSA